MQPRIHQKLPYATAKSLKILGKIRIEPADFRVDEFPAYEPCGEGEHLFVRFEKTGLGTPDAVRMLANALGCDPRGASWAGLKDRHAVTTQWASFQHAEAARATPGLALDGIRVLEAVPHRNKLKTGHLRGNRFRILVREPRGDIAVANDVLAQLQARGVPNYYGEQRFGIGGQNLHAARQWLIEGGRGPRDRFKRKLLVSTLQSDAFNGWLAARVEAGELATAIEGDLLRKEDSGGLFTTDDLADARRRVEAWQISATGPMFGTKMRWPLGEALARERHQMELHDITDDTFLRVRKLAAGTRRAARVRPGSCSVEATDAGLLFTFDLPKGAYATVVLRELMKDDGAPDCT